jgi:uncharacterized protein
MPPHVVEHPEQGIKCLHNLRIPMEDGIRLAADLYAPLAAPLDGSEPLPVVMEYIPYRKDDVGIPVQSHWYGYLPAHGYLVLRVDCRGTGASEGTTGDEYTEREQRDGHDAVEWCAVQPWCDGHVNMIGISYGGFTSLQVASHAPPHLTSIVPIDFTDDRYTDDCHYRGGHARMLLDPGFYGAFMVAFNALPPAPARSLPDWAEIWEAHLGGDEPYVLEWLRHQVDGPYWRNGSVGEIADRIHCPVFMIGGWRDGYPNPPLRLFERLSVPRRLIIGPWDHAVPNVAAPGPRIDYLAEVVRWLDHWCRADGGGELDEPPVVVYMQRYDPPDPDRLESTGEWRAERAWPPAGLEERTLSLAEDGRLAEQAGADGIDVLVYEPGVGMQAGLHSIGQLLSLPGDQRPDEAFSRVYTSPPLREPVTVLGRARADLRVETSATVIGFAVSLSDVAPDGTSALVAKGMRNATRRTSLSAPQPVEVGVPFDLPIEIDATGWTFEAGHRIRLAVANADFPNVWPTPEPATSGIHRGGASVLVLPVVPPESPLPPPAFAPSQVAVERKSSLHPRPSFRAVRDALTGHARFELDYAQPRGDPSQTWHFAAEAEVDPRDPASASVHGTCRVERRYGAIAVDARSQVIVQGSASDFHVVIDVATLVNGRSHFSRRWVETVPRDLL